MSKLLIAKQISDRIYCINNKYNNINYGGCGTFSYHLYHSLKLNYDIDTDIVYIPSDTSPGRMPTYDIKFSHILLKWDNWLIDNNGFKSINGLKTEYLGIEKLKEMVRIPELWNDNFNHKQTIELSKDLLKI